MQSKCNIMSQITRLCLVLSGWLFFVGCAWSAKLPIHHDHFSFTKHSLAFLIPDKIIEKAEEIAKYQASKNIYLSFHYHQKLKVFWKEIEELQYEFIQGWDGTAGTALNHRALLPFYLTLGLSENALKQFKYAGMPENQVLSYQVLYWNSSLIYPKITSEGLIDGVGAFEQFDPHWMLTALECYSQIIGYSKVEPFNETPAIIKPPLSEQPLKIIMLGDWGTNTENARAVMTAAAKHNADYVIHLGDIYYSGTEKETNDNFLNHFVGGSKGSLTLNGNHEMAAAGKGYFNVALQSEIFKIQKKSSFFAIEYDPWVIIGLDSAYDADDIYYVNGRIKRQSQKELIQKYYAQGKRIIILTHHNPMDHKGLSLTPLWDDVTLSMHNNAPEYWYYGHVHIGVSYSEYSAMGQRGTKARCVGHSGIPAGIGSDYFYQSTRELLSTIDYYSHTPQPNSSYQILNGYLLLTLDQEKAQDQFYEQ